VKEEGGKRIGKKGRLRGKGWVREEIIRKK
jgi:hypothetical protein